MYLKLKMLFNHWTPIENIVKKQYLNVFNDFIKIVNVFRKKCPFKAVHLECPEAAGKKRKDKLSCFPKIGSNACVMVVSSALLGSVSLYSDASHLHITQATQAGKLK